MRRLWQALLVAAALWEFGQAGIGVYAAAVGQAPDIPVASKFYRSVLSQWRIEQARGDACTVFNVFATFGTHGWDNAPDADKSCGFTRDGLLVLISLALSFAFGFAAYRLRPAAA